MALPMSEIQEQARREAAEWLATYKRPPRGRYARTHFGGAIGARCGHRHAKRVVFDWQQVTCAACLLLRER